jgi:uncharacterized coiled-coil protein SlyX
MEEAAQVQQAEERMGALEAGLSAQVQRADESMNCVVELQQAVGQAKARMVSAIRSYTEANGSSDSVEASDGSVEASDGEDT